MGHFFMWYKFFCRYVVVLVFYGPSTLLSSYQVQSVYLSTLFLGKLPRQLPVLSAHSFASSYKMCTAIVTHSLWVSCLLFLLVEWLLSLDHGLAGSNPTGGRILSKPK